MVQGTKQNIICIGQIANKGNVIIFTSNGWNIIEEDTREIIEKEV